MDNITIDTDSNLTAQEVVKLRVASGWDGDIDEWQSCIMQCLVAVSARNTKNELVGVGFLSGNARHAEIVDLVVLPDYRQHGIGENILEELIKRAKTEKIKYLSLTYDKKAPWLKDFYERHGFKSIDFAMWHEDSLHK
jgi:N-acetylglutamate synthase-like GNAT family acetyltransferase